MSAIHCALLCQLSTIMRFVASHGHHASLASGSVRFRCADGEFHSVTTMAAARKALGY